MSKKLLVLAAAFICLMGLLATVDAADGPKRGGVLRLAAVSDPPNYDPCAATSHRIHIHVAGVFSGLVRTDPMKEEVSVENMIPDLAEKWDISPDGKTYTFYLRKGVKFHDGHPFTAKDVKYSMERFRDPKRSIWAANVQSLDKIEIVDDYTVKMSLKYKHPEFLVFITAPYGSILPAHLEGTNPKSTDFLVGTGPFKFKKYVPGKVSIYERNPDYYIKGLPYLDGFEVYFLKHEAIADAFVGGRLDVSGTLRELLDSNVDNFMKVKKHAPEAVAICKPEGSTRGVFFGFKQEGPWQDAKVRKAMAMIIDYDQMINAYVGGPELGYQPAAGPVPYYLKAALPKEKVAKLYGIDQPMAERIKKAKALMKSAGFPDGFKAQLLIRAREQNSVNASLYAADLWKRHLGIEITIKELDRANFYPKRDKGDFQLLADSISTATGSLPIEMLNVFLTGQKRNYGKWSNKEYDSLITKMAAEPDKNKKIELARQAQTLLLDAMPYLIFGGTATGTAWRPDLRTGWPAVKGLVLQPKRTAYKSIDQVWLEGTAKRWMK